jgi:hypothetical protein
MHWAAGPKPSKEHPMTDYTHDDLIQIGRELATMQIDPSEWDKPGIEYDIHRAYIKAMLERGQK